MFAFFAAPFKSFVQFINLSGIRSRARW